VTRPRVRSHGAAREEAEAAVRWYDERLPGLGADFIAEVDSAVARIADAPPSWPICPLDPRARWVLLSRFPYSVVYLVHPSSSSVIVAAVAHAKRRPGYWRQRLRPLR
jgi:toxin ParE1/3/4